jgi:hypothetical protein
MTAPARGRAAAAALPAWDLAAAALAAAAVAVAGAADSFDLCRVCECEENQMGRMTSSKARAKIALAVLVVGSASLFSPSVIRPQQASANSPAIPAAKARQTFDTPQKAAEALVNAAEKFDVAALTAIFGPGGEDIVFTGEFPQDRQRAVDFAAEAREKESVSVDPKTGNRAFLLVGNEDWPFPVPIVKNGTQWAFDAAAGRKELLYRRIGSNELDAIEVCHGYVEAQYEFAFRQRNEYEVNQYAQRIISTPGQRDGLAWQNSNGTWEGPIGEKIAEAIQQGYSPDVEPYHGYFFKILKGQGPAAPLGEMDYVVKGAMIGGFALVAAPAEYAVTGVKTFVVSQDGVVYEKDFGPATLQEFAKMERFNPDKSWTPVPANEN